MREALPGGDALVRKHAVLLPAMGANPSRQVHTNPLGLEADNEHWVVKTSQSLEPSAAQRWVGVAVGALVGDPVGPLVVGTTVGCAVGKAVGVFVGDDVGALVGAAVGALVVGVAVGAHEAQSQRVIPLTYTLELHPQRSKAEELMLVKESGMTIEVKFVHPLNA